MIDAKKDIQFMSLALNQAKLAFNNNEVPVGAVIVRDNQVIAKAHNQPIKSHNPVAHAEILALIEAGQFLKSERLNNCEIYVTLEPCNMCMAALNLAKVSRIVYGLEQEAGNHSYLLQSPDIEITVGVLKLEVKEILQEFFQTQRQKNKLEAQ